MLHVVRWAMHAPLFFHAKRDLKAALLLFMLLLLPLFLLLLLLLFLLLLLLFLLLLCLRSYTLNFKIKFAKCRSCCPKLHHAA